MRVAALLVLGCAAGRRVYMAERFDSRAAFAARWVGAAPQKDGPALGRWAVAPQTGLTTLDRERYYALGARLDAPVENAASDLVVQFSVRYPEGATCGGGYVKLFTDAQLPDLTRLGAATPYVLLFGPDYCGAKRRLLVEFGRGGKAHGIRREIALPQDLVGVAHLYTLVLRADDSYCVRIDNAEAAAGRLEDDWDMVPPRLVPDPDARKPADWVDDPDMDDPADAMPDDWNAGVPEHIVDADAEPPSDWDEAAEGRAWAPPAVRNPAHRGAWRPRRVPNPRYAGPWAPAMVANPAHVPGARLHDVSGASVLGLEHWQVQRNVRFGNILITDDDAHARSSAEASWRPQYEADSRARAQAIADFRAMHAARLKQDAAAAAAAADHDGAPSFDEL